MNLTEAVDDAELTALFSEWGDAPRIHHELNVADPFLSGDQQRLVSNGRRAEICYVMHRGDPNDGLLLHIKTIYPDGAYRLPTGGIHQGEAVFETLVREIYEETGLVVGAGVDQVTVERFLGVVSYRMRHRTLGNYNFATYPFLVQMPHNAQIETQDPDEQIGGWRWQTPGELIGVANYLAAVGNVDPVWADWGVYRAILHRFLARQLDKPQAADPFPDY